MHDSPDAGFRSAATVRVSVNSITNDPPRNVCCAKGSIDLLDGPYGLVLVAWIGSNDLGKNCAFVVVRTNSTEHRSRRRRRLTVSRRTKQSRHVLAPLHRPVGQAVCPGASLIVGRRIFVSRTNPEPDSMDSSCGCENGLGNNSTTAIADEALHRPGIGSEVSYCAPDSVLRCTAPEKLVGRYKLLCRAANRDDGRRAVSESLCEKPVSGQG